MNLTRGQFLKLVFGKFEGFARFAYNNREAGKADWKILFRWPQDLDDILEWVMEERHARDLYFCPHLFVEPDAKKELAAPSAVLYADLDDCLPDKLGEYGEPKPNIVVQTSEQHWQAYWLLHRRVDPAIYEQLNHRIALSYAKYGCDKGGWDLTQLLRIPETYNFKREEPFQISPANLVQRIRVSPNAFEKLPALPAEPALEDIDFDSLGKPPPIPLYGRDLRLWNKRPPVGDRSEHIFKLGRLLIERLKLRQDLAVIALAKHPVNVERLGKQGALEDARRVITKIVPNKGGNVQ